MRIRTAGPVADMAARTVATTGSARRRPGGRGGVRRRRRRPLRSTGTTSETSELDGDLHVVGEAALDELPPRHAAADRRRHVGGAGQRGQRHRRLHRQPTRHPGEARPARWPPRAGPPPTGAATRPATAHRRRSRPTGASVEPYPWRRSQRPTARALRRHAATTGSPVALAAALIAEPFGEGSTRSATTGAVRNAAGESDHGCVRGRPPAADRGDRADPRRVVGRLLTPRERVHPHAAADRHLDGGGERQHVHHHQGRADPAELGRPGQPPVEPGAGAGLGVDGRGQRLSADRSRRAVAGHREPAQTRPGRSRQPRPPSADPCPRSARRHVRSAGSADVTPAGAASSVADAAASTGTVPASATGSSAADDRPARRPPACSARGRPDGGRRSGPRAPAPAPPRRRRRARGRVAVCAVAQLVQADRNWPCTSSAPPAGSVTPIELPRHAALGAEGGERLLVSARHRHQRPGRPTR